MIILQQFNQFKQSKLLITTLDLLGKLYEYGFWVLPSNSVSAPVSSAHLEAKSNNTNISEQPLPADNAVPYGLEGLRGLILEGVCCSFVSGEQTDEKV